MAVAGCMCPRRVRTRQGSSCFRPLPCLISGLIVTPRLLPARAGDKTGYTLASIQDNVLDGNYWSAIIFPAIAILTLTLFSTTITIGIMLQFFLSLNAFFCLPILAFPPLFPPKSITYVASYLASYLSILHGRAKSYQLSSLRKM